ncbi:MAG: serine/threonine-protein kinase [Rudaea sp.]
MDVDRYARLRKLYEAVVDVEPAARAEVLAQEDADAQLAAEALALCDAADCDRTGALTGVRDAMLDVAVAPLPAAGEVFGAWRIVEVVGQGGMGRVYRVERSDGSYEQTAALKFIKGLAGEAAVANFTRERQLLAGLVHPNIARLLDGGMDAQGRPYLVMEYIAGRPIDDYCRESALGRNAILDLFVAACAAVSHAHRQLVVHCDLKPSNILVDMRGQPMLLDFGIAQMVERSADDAGVASDTTSGYTPGYASPEQCRGERIGVASDVYSLGMVLRRMFVAANVETGPELVAILAMATQEDSAARYASVDALCDDLARLRTRRPVRALPATVAYRCVRFVRRNWVALSIAAGIVLLSAMFTWKVMAESRHALAAEQTALAERDRARQAESEARASENTAHETSRFLISVFEGASPDAGSGNVSIAVLLDQALQRVEHDLTDQPATQAQMSAVLAEVLFVIGKPERGRALYAKAIALERTQNRPLVLAKMLIDNAGTYLKYTAGGTTPNDDVREALRLVESNASEDSPVRMDLTQTAAGLLGDSNPAEAAPLFEKSLVLMRRLKPGSLDLAEALASYGWNERRRGNYEHAIALMSEANALQLRLLGEANQDYSLEMETIANTMTLARRFDEAGPLFLRALELQRRYGRMDGKVGAWALAQYATFLTNAGRAMEALPLYDEIFAIAARKLSKDDGSVLVWEYNFAGNVADTGDLDHAAKLIREAAAKVRHPWGPDSLGMAMVLVKQANILEWHDCDAEAGAALDRALAIYAAKPAQENDDLYAAKVQRARWLTSCKRFDEAQAQLGEVAPHNADLKPLAALHLAQAQALLRLQRDGDAAALATMQDAESLAAKAYTPADARIALAKLPRAEWLHAHGRNDEAAKLGTAILAGVDGKLVPDSPLLARVRALR